MEYNAAGQIRKREKNISDERRSKELAMNSSENITELVTYFLFKCFLYVCCMSVIKYWGKRARRKCI